MQKRMIFNVGSAAGAAVFLCAVALAEAQSNGTWQSDACHESTDHCVEDLRSLDYDGWGPTPDSCVEAHRVCFEQPEGWSRENDSCQARCPDGHLYRTCSEDGRPIYYFADPCMDHYGSSSSMSSLSSEDESSESSSISSFESSTSVSSRWSWNRSRASDGASSRSRWSWNDDDDSSASMQSSSKASMCAIPAMAAPPEGCSYDCRDVSNGRDFCPEWDCDLICESSASSEPSWSDDQSSSVGEEGCFCTMQFDPVCGEDGQTYANSCVAGCQGVGVEYEGACEMDATH